MKQSPNGARGYILVSMEGIPYWAEKRYYKPTISDCFNDFSIKNCGYKTLQINDYSISNLSRDSNEKNIF